MVYAGYATSEVFTMCPFCTRKSLTVLLETEHFYAILDRAPVTKGHALIISKQHRSHLYQLTDFEWADLRRALQLLTTYLDRHYPSNGYNIGTNVGEVAGQTVMHLHVHVIPRRAGDVENPRGGVRNLMKPLQELWPDE